MQGRRAGGRTNGWTGVDGQADGPPDRRMGRRAGGQTGGRTDQRTGGRTDGPTDKCKCRCIRPRATTDTDTGRHGLGHGLRAACSNTGTDFVFVRARVGHWVVCSAGATIRRPNAGTNAFAISILGIGNAWPQPWASPGGPTTVQWRYRGVPIIRKSRYKKV